MIRVMEPAGAAESSKSPFWYSAALLILCIAAIAIRFFYWSYTNRTWEDALITVLHSENAVHGLGLTHVKPGEPPLHGFTSPLSVLIPLAGDLIHSGFGLTLIKILSALLGGVAAWLGARLSRILGLPYVLALTVAAFLAFEHHQILWGMAGMETQAVTVAYLWAICAALRGGQWEKGTSLGVCMLARPDAAFLVAIVLAAETWRAWAKRSLRALGPVLAGLAIVYGPWIVFTTLYYGSPVPNTILAKSLGYSSAFAQLSRLSALAKAVWIERRFTNIFATLGPAYGGNGTGFVASWDQYLLSRIAVFLMLPGAVAAFRKRHWEALVVYAFLAAYAIYLTFLVNLVFGWYTAPIVAAGVIGSAYGLWRFVEPFLPAGSRLRFVAVTSAVYIAAIAANLPATMQSDKHIQQYVEDEGRAAVGRFIHDVSQPTDTIGSESLGYVAYYSRRPVYDYPGMCSRRVVEYLRTHPRERSLIGMMEHLRPTFLVLRPHEYRTEDGRVKYPWIERDYELLRTFRVPDDERAQILDAQYNVDFEFGVWRAKTAQ